MKFSFNKILGMANRFEQMAKTASEDAVTKTHQEWLNEQTNDAFNGEFGRVAKAYANKFSDDTYTKEELWLIAPERIDILFDRLLKAIKNHNFDGSDVDVLDQKEVSVAKQKLSFLSHHMKRIDQMRDVADSEEAEEAEEESFED
jgi:hypothetical protein